MAGRALASLRAFARQRAAVDRCELCASPLAPEHDHALHRETRRLACACAPCTTVVRARGVGPWTPVRPRRERLAGVHLGEEQWRQLGVPVTLAFFVHDDRAGQVVACYPSPGGLVESPVDPVAWDVVAAAHPSLTLAPGVEALLVNRMEGRCDAYLVSVDTCFRLVHVLRTQWRGFGGGETVREHVRAFFAGLDAAEAHA